MDKLVKVNTENRVYTGKAFTPITIPDELRRRSIEALQKYREMFPNLHKFLQILNTQAGNLGNEVVGMPLMEFAKNYGSQYPSKIIGSPFCNIERAENHEKTETALVISCIDEGYTSRCFKIVQNKYPGAVIYYRGHPGVNITHTNQIKFAEFKLQQAIELNADLVVFASHPDCAAANGDNNAATKQAEELSEIFNNLSNNSDEANHMQSIYIGATEIEQVKREFHQQPATTVNLSRGAFRAEIYNEMIRFPVMHQGPHVTIKKLVEDLLLGLKINLGNHGLGIKPYSFTFITAKKPSFNKAETENYSKLKEDISDSVLPGNEENLERIIELLKHKIRETFPELQENDVLFQVLWIDE